MTLSKPAIPNGLQGPQTTYTPIAQLFDKRHLVEPVKKSFCFLTGASAKPKATDLPIIPKAVDPYISIQVGEDAFFSRHDSMGVADGVGGWSEVKGANPALYSLKLMHYAKCQLEQHDDLMGELEYNFNLDEYSLTSPKNILSQSYACTNRDAMKEKIIGSTTALILILRDDELRIANIGDCGVMIIRGGEPIFRSEEQQHSFNFPFQLGTNSRDSPNDTQLFTIKIQEGDVVVIGTDGLFDNVFDEDIVDIIASKTLPTVTLSDPQQMSDALLRRAREVAEDSRFSSSPFQERAIQEGFYYQGGKVDDITVLCGIICVSEDSPDRRPLTHEEITHQSIYFAGFSNSSLLQELLRDYPSHVQAGTFFPDWGYNCLYSAAGEAAHWQPFWTKAIEHLHATYEQPYGRAAKSLMAFTLGVISHDVADVLWHSLGMEQGFIDAMKFQDYGGLYATAHLTADLGGDFAISRFGKSDSYLSSWTVPTNDVIEIYRLLNITVTYSQISMCVTGGYAFMELEKAMGKYLFPRLASYSPFLAENYFQYFRGGVQYMATSVSECWGRAVDWFAAGQVQTQCPHMARSNNNPLQSAEAKPATTSCLASHFLKVDTDFHSLTVSNTLLSKVLARSCAFTKLNVLSSETPASLNASPRPLVVFVESSVAAIWDYVTKPFRPSCTRPDSSNSLTLYSTQDYARLGESLLVGDFNGDGIPDLLLGAPGYSFAGAPQAGAVFYMQGPMSHNLGTAYIENTSVTIRGPPRGAAQFGTSLAAVDLNRDGIDDLAISAPYIGSESNEPDGSVFVLFGSKNGFRKDGKFDLTINGTVSRTGPVFDGKQYIYDNRFSVLGEKLYGIDVDGDSFSDLLLGSPHATPIVGGDQRGVLSAFLSSSAHTGTASYLAADWSIAGTADYEWFGSSVEKMDQTLVVGSPGYSDGTVPTAGRIQGYSLSRQHGTRPQFQFGINGDAAHGKFGSRLSVYGRQTDLLVASPSQSSMLAAPKFMNLEGILVPAGKKGYQGGAVTLLRNLSAATGSFDRSTSMEGTGALGHFGHDIAQSARSQLIVSEPMVEGESGRVHLYDSPSSETHCWQGSFHQRFGQAIATLDLDRDGTEDLVVASANQDYSHSESAQKWGLGLLSGGITILWNALQ
ncbi:Glycosylphosphatidylinositol specific phospholipase D1 [Kappamyces sp. JEL0829]|nr:Glycosylphosphatidylinositol specific phospholipase D1 [Kappamyces sp. JEL0829]